MTLYLYVAFAAMIIFMFFYVYVCITIFYILYTNDFNDTQIEVDTKLNYTYNHTYIISNALRNAALQNM